MHRSLLSPLLLVLVTCGCRTPGPAASDLAADLALDRDLAVDSPVRAPDGLPASDFDAGPDLDGDGIPDALEDSLARQYLPYLSVHPGDNCPLHGLIFRLTRHPADPKLILVRYDVLYLRDCGDLPHVGDDENFSALVDPRVPAPAGLLAVRGISHRGTPCEHTTTCGSLPGCAACTTAMRDGQRFPVVFPSVNKHGNYAKKLTCDTSILCDLGGCALDPTPDPAPLVNVGEPGKPLVTDLSTQGFVTEANGWSEPALLHYDPWGGTSFGGAGKPASDLVAPAFIIGPSGC